VLCASRELAFGRPTAPRPLDAYGRTRGRTNHAIRASAGAVRTRTPPRLWPRSRRQRSESIPKLPSWTFPSRVLPGAPRSETTGVPCPLRWRVRRTCPSDRTSVSGADPETVTTW